MPSGLSLLAMRRRLPLGVLLLIAAVCLLLGGFACGCLDSDPALALEAVLHAPALPGGFAAPPAAFVGLLLVSAFAARAPSRSRASPAVLQRFLI